MPAMPPLSAETLPMFRSHARSRVEPLLEGRRVERREVAVRGRDGHDLAMTVIAPDTGSDRPPSACVLWLHGGGMVMGDRFAQLDIPLEWLDELGVVVASIEYRLAPEATGTALVEDAFAGLAWIAGHAAEIGADPARTVVAGTSAGGGIAAGLVLLARDRGVPVAAQLLVCPMLDHRNRTVSSRQFAGPGVWSCEENAFGWSSVLGGAGPAAVSPYVSPAVATDLSGLPTTYLDAGSAEVFRDEVVDYASRVWAAGGQAELHVWAGGCHGFDSLHPGAALSVSARRARLDWLRRTLSA
ncbi:alpha/beta hydrolase [Allonocardiopsis opalescens]|nr:alpha/beta hydrolase [Allonocardiopsis opalescens]